MNDLMYLRSFLDTYRTGLVTVVAHRHRITRPAASVHTAALETMLGDALLTRQARGVTPTPAGEGLARSVATHLDGIKASMGVTHARSSHLSGTVHIVGPGENGSAVLVDAAPTDTPQAPGPLQWNGAYGHSCFFQGANRLSVVALTNTAFEPCSARCRWKSGMPSMDSGPLMAERGFVKVRRCASVMPPSLKSVAV